MKSKVMIQYGISLIVVLVTRNFMFANMFFSIHHETFTESFAYGCLIAVCLTIPWMFWDSIKKDIFSFFDVTPICIIIFVLWIISLLFIHDMTMILYLSFLFIIIEKDYFHFIRMEIALKEFKENTK